MAQDFTVSRAFLATEDDKTTPQVINTKAGACHKYIFQVDNQPVEGWLNTLRKIEDGKSKELKVGDTVYGDIVENNWGKAQFDKAQKPFTPGQGNAQSAPKPSQASQAGIGGNSEAKLDYIISMLENFLKSKSTGVKGQDVIVTDIEDDDKPVDLSELPY